MKARALSTACSGRGNTDSGTCSSVLSTNGVSAWPERSRAYCTLCHPPSFGCALQRYWHALTSEPDSGGLSAKTEDVVSRAATHNNTRTHRRNVRPTHCFDSRLIGPYDSYSRL